MDGHRLTGLKLGMSDKHRIFPFHADFVAFRCPSQDGVQSANLTISGERNIHRHTLSAPPDPNFGFEHRMHDGVGAGLTPNLEVEEWTTTDLGQFIIASDFRRFIKILRAHSAT